MSETVHNNINIWQDYAALHDWGVGVISGRRHQRRLDELAQIHQAGRRVAEIIDRSTLNPGGLPERLHAKFLANFIHPIQRQCAAVNRIIAVVYRPSCTRLQRAEIVGGFFETDDDVHKSRAQQLDDSALVIGGAGNQGAGIGLHANSPVCGNRNSNQSCEGEATRAGARYTGTGEAIGGGAA